MTVVSGNEVGLFDMAELITGHLKYENIFASVDSLAETNETAPNFPPSKKHEVIPRKMGLVGNLGHSPRFRITVHQQQCQHITFQSTAHAQHSVITS